MKMLVTDVQVTRMIMLCILAFRFVYEVNAARAFLISGVSSTSHGTQGTWKFINKLGGARLAEEQRKKKPPGGRWPENCGEGEGVYASLIGR